MTVAAGRESAIQAMAPKGGDQGRAVQGLAVLVSGG